MISPEGERIKYLPRPVGAYKVRAFDWDASLLSRLRRSVEVHRTDDMSTDDVFPGIDPLDEFAN